MVTLILEVQTEVNVIIPFSTDVHEDKIRISSCSSSCYGRGSPFLLLQRYGQDQAKWGETQGQSGQMPILPPIQVDEE